MAEFSIKSEYTGTEPITLPEAKAFLRVDSTDDNDYITELIKMARQLVEKETNTTLVTNTYIEYYNSFPSGAITLQYAGNVEPTTGLVITYENTAGSTTTMALTTDFLYTKGQGLINILPADSWPSDVEEQTNSIKISYSIYPEGGIDSAPYLPLPLKQAMYLLIGHFYDNRSAVTFGSPKELPIGYNRIIKQYKNTIWSR